MITQDAEPFRPALIVVDFQEDFCPPNGSLAVSGGRDIASTINKLMDLPWVLKIATQDWHPANHISFASQHVAPDNVPFTSLQTVKNPLNADESESIRLWPDHCVQDTHGAQFIGEFDVSKIDHVVKKGQDRRVEMYSAFKDTYTQPCVSESDLSGMLRDASISHVYVVGLALDFCVRHTALHAAAEGYETHVLLGATKAVDQSEEALESLREDIEGRGVHVRAVDGPEVRMVAHRRGG